MWSDLRYAVRMLRRTPGFTAVVLVTLGLGIGANTAIFSAVNALLLRPLPLPEPGRLLFVTGTQVGPGYMPFSVIAYEAMQQSHSYTGIAAFGREGLTLTGKGDPAEFDTARVAPAFFDVLQAQPVLGRAFEPSDGDAGAKPVAVISHRLWQNRFGGDPRILGQAIALGDEVSTVIGVMPSGFAFPAPEIDIWTTRLIHYTGLLPEQIRNGGGFLSAIARLKPGVSLDQARAEMDVISRQYRHEHAGSPDADPAGKFNVSLLQDTLVSDIRPALLILMGAVGLVLLIACANVAGLTLARATGRGKEIVVRSALGASQGVLVRQMLSESFLLALGGAALGLLFAHWGILGLTAMLGANLPLARPISLDPYVLGFTVALSIATAILVGLLPALQVSRPDLNSALRDSSWGSTAGAGRHRLRSVLAAAQMALSVVLLIGAGLLVESFLALRTVDGGFDPHNTLSMQVSLPPARYPDDTRRAQFVRDVLDRLAAIPGVRSAVASVSLPLDTRLAAPFLAQGQPVVPIAQRPTGIWNAITPGYFSTLSIPLLQGRDFTSSDDEKAPRRVIVSQSLARHYFPDQNPIGKHLTYARREYDAEIVGVAGDVKTQNLETDSGMVFYTPYPQFAWPNISLTVRTSGAPRQFLNAARAQVFAADRDLPVANPRTLEDLVDSVLAGRRQTMVLVAGFSLVALLLAVLGLYGLMAYSVAQRTAEIGIRQAVGASRRDILRMVLGQGLRLSLLGIGAGIVAALAFTRLIEAMLFHVHAADAKTYVGISVLFLAIALASSALPAWRATQVDPLEALRDR